ncbi:MAG TPA: hypothetical protein VME70_05790 [Mycobacteriales bacterium]|nr:hypothetical protein [Mycobacteriales bacterium]
MAGVIWKDETDEHDYPAAENYLTLLARAEVVRRLVTDLRGADVIHQKAKDILRASGLPLLDVDNPHVAADLKKIRKGRPLSPVLLVRGDIATGRFLQIADGYHRVCASYHYDENTDIPCRLVALVTRQRTT